jgi:predicted amidohydrolase YtcJ
MATFLSLNCNQSEPKVAADFVIINASIWTANPALPEATALAVKSDTLLAVGSKQEIEPFIGKSTKIIDAQGKFVVPGFIDSHVHFLEGGMNLMSVQLRDASTKEEFIKRIGDFAKTLSPGEWITGGDWDHENWGGELPTKSWIDSVTPENPVWINRLDGHMALANSKAMALAGVNTNTGEIKGGAIIRLKNGEPTGVFKDNAMRLIDRVFPALTDEMRYKALNAATNYVASLGVTSVHNKSYGPGTWDFYKKAAANKQLKIRIYTDFALHEAELLKAETGQNGYGDKWLRIGGLKAFLDGSLGSHTAAFFEPYTDLPTDNGLFVADTVEMYKQIKQADEAGFQLHVHAIGDRAISALLNIYEKVTRENGPRDRRFRIEHTQHLLPSDIQRIADLNVIASMQPYHCIDDGRWAEKLIGAERCKTTYAFKSLLEAKAKLCFGSDWFVAPPDPIWGIYAAVTRATLDGKNPGGWIPEQKIGVEDALKAYTINAAYASFEEDIKGSLEPGKLADICILDKDIRKIAPEEIKDIKVAYTIVGGEIIYQKKD